MGENKKGSGDTLSLEQYTSKESAIELEDESAKIVPLEARETAQEYLLLALHTLADICGAIPYRVLGSSAHFLHDAQYFLERGKLPDDIDIAVQRASDLERLFRKMNEYTTHISETHARSVLFAILYANSMKPRSPSRDI